MSILTPRGVQMLCSLVRDRYQHQNIDYIIGPESRGFLGALFCNALGCGFLPVRKAGKLPGQCASVTYNTEYSTDTLEISLETPIHGNVLLFDDLIATGGSLAATQSLVQRAHPDANIVDILVLREVPELRDVAEAKGLNYTVLIK